MPLKKGKSEASFKYNVKKELESGKPLKQALAIAFSVKRRSSKEDRDAKTDAVKRRLKRD